MHKRLGTFLREVCGQISSVPTINIEYKNTIDKETSKFLLALEQFDVFFGLLRDNPILRSTIKSEVSRLNDLKNCDYHRQKIDQFMNDYNKCVEENLKLKESNLKSVMAK